MKTTWILVGLAFLVALHHYWISGKWFDWEDVLNHETAIVFFLGMAFATYLCQRKKA
jgi:hypothetical protein